MSGALAGVSVLVTRPAHQAESLCRLIEAQGGKVHRLPLLTIEPGPDREQAQARLGGGHDLWIFTSTNAVRQALPLLPSVWPALVAAIGPATAAALDAIGAAAGVVPFSGASTEDLLAHPAFAQVSGRRILVITGVGGRNALESRLEERGAMTERAEVYRRVPLPYPESTVATAVRRSRVLLVSSGAGLQRLVEVTPLSVQSLMRKRWLVAPSARVVEQALALGFHKPLAVAGPMSDAALCAACVSAVSDAK